MTALAPGTVLPEYTVRAHNSSEQSENKIHDNTVARQYGFEGGLVPGVTVHGYMTRPVLDALGMEWLERGTISTRFIKPFYQDELVTVRTTVTSAGDSGPVLELVAVNDRGDTCAIGTASLPAERPAAPSFDEVPVAPPATVRPPVSYDVLSGMSVLGTVETSPAKIAEERARVEELHDDHPAYRGETAVVHPGFLIRYANTVLSQAVQLGPWIHVSSDVRHYSTVLPGEGFQTRGRITELFERKGHKFVTLDVLQAAGGRVVTRNTHTAIYDIRRVDA